MAQRHTTPWWRRCLVYCLVAVVVLGATPALANQVNLLRLYERAERLRHAAVGRSASAKFVPRMPLSAPTVPTQTNQTHAEEVKEHWIDQPLDHWARPSSAVFKQRYYVNDTFWHAGGPVLLYIGGEGRLAPDRAVKGQHVELAQRLGAMLFLVEHRFYGKSLPTNATLTANTLRFLTTQQALADLAYFRVHLGEARNLTSSRWVAIGGSYAGSLAAWFRLKYPHLVDGAWSSSAPLVALEVFPEYDHDVAVMLGNECVNAVHKALTEIESVLSTGGEAREDLMKSFECESVTNDVAFLYVLADTIAYGVQYGKAVHLCPSLLNKTRPAEYVEAYAQFSRAIFREANATCEDFNIAGFTSIHPDEEDCMRQWMWQSCTELGFFQVSNLPGHSVRSRRITVEWHRSVCKRLFDVELQPHATETNILYSGKDFYGSNVFFTNGEKDPWRFLSIMERETPVSICAVVIKGAHHCDDLHQTNYTTDSHALVTARKDISEAVQEFINEAHIAPHYKFLDEDSKRDKEVTVEVFVISSIFIALVSIAIGSVIMWIVMDRRQAYHSLG